MYSPKKEIAHRQMNAISNKIHQKVYNIPLLYTGKNRIASIWCGRGVYNMEKETLQKIKKQLKWKERLLIKFFPKTTLKIYHIGRVDAINAML